MIFLRFVLKYFGEIKANIASISPNLFKILQNQNHEIMINHKNR